MDFSEVNHTWEILHPNAHKTGPQLQRALGKHDQSLIAEFAAGAWLVSQGYALEKSELVGDRVQSPRRRDRSKTCDFELIKAGEKSPIYVEVKHMLGEGTLKSFLQSAHLKGARWLVVVVFEKDNTPREIRAEDLPKESWSEHAVPKQILKYRRNGLVKVMMLHLS